jgi:hypothetical protein
VDLRQYYRRIREVESTLPEPFVVLVSLDTQDGGKPGVLTEASRAVAARIIADGRARVATEEEAAKFHLENQQAKKAADELAALNRVQVVVVPARSGYKGAKE